jgi:NCS1 family nucleobase:cation symporter-1
VVIGFALFSILVATLSVNVAANTVSPSYDFSNLLPKLVSFRTGGIITGVIGILIQPWRLLANPHIYIFVWLGFYGGLLGAVAGVLIADYWLIRRTELRLVDLYRPGGAYWYAGGWNWRGVLAFLVGAVLAVGGAWSAPGQGPFPQDGLIPALKPLYNYNWVVGFGAALILYFVFSGGRARTRVPKHAYAGGR